MLIALLALIWILSALLTLRLYYLSFLPYVAVEREYFLDTLLLFMCFVMGPFGVLAVFMTARDEECEPVRAFQLYPQSPDPVWKWFYDKEDFASGLRYYNFVRKAALIRKWDHVVVEPDKWAELKRQVGMDVEERVWNDSTP